MTEIRSIEVSDLVDGQKIGTSAIVFLAIATLVLIGDGYDFFAVAFAAPELVKEWHVQRAALGPVLSSSVVGLLFGGPLLGYVGDRFGRKKAIVGGLIGFGIFTLLCADATSLGQLVVLRFLTGIGLGGVIPNIIALTAEFAPKRLRGTFIIVVNFGVPAGAAIPGWVAALFVSRHGWPILFVIGGILPLVIAALAWSLMPESIKFLVERGGRGEQVRRAAAALRPDLAFAPDARFVVATPSPVVGGASPTRLFRDGLGVITPVLWIALSANQIANFFTNSWLPTLLQAAGASTAQAGISASMFAIGGMVGGLVLTFLIDRFGVIPIVVLYVVGSPLVAAIGAPGLTPGVLTIVIACAGFCVVGINFGLNATMGMIYPTPIRSVGAGWAQALGRLGSITGPVLGGILVGMQLTNRQLFAAPAIALAVGAIACGLLAMFCVRRFRGYQLDEHVASLAEVGFTPRVPEQAQ